MFRAVTAFAVVLAVTASAQTQPETNPEQEWNSMPVEEKGKTPPGPAVAPAPPPGPAAAPAPAPRAPVVGDTSRAASSAPTTARATRPMLEPNTVSMFGARSLGQWGRGQMIYLGFPLIGIRLALGLAERFDLSIGFDSFYGMMNQPLAGLRVNFFRGANWNMAVVLEGGPAFFTTRASVDTRGPRWLTGRRNGNAMGGIVFSYQSDHPRAARLFLQLSYLLTFDTEPFQDAPLGGVPASLQLGHNGVLRAGAEMPLSAKTSFVFLLGLDAHGRYPRDSIVMPNCSVGLVTSI